MTTHNVKLQVSEAAKFQIALMKEHDFTLEGKEFRLEIGGKGCDGFTYQMGFSDLRENDITLPFLSNNQSFLLCLDPFTAHYCFEGIVDYLFDPNSGDEGFVYQNTHETEYRGKFFKDQSKLPPENLKVSST